MAKRKTGGKSRLVKNYSERNPAWNSLLLLTQSHATNHYLLCFSLRFFFAIPSVKVSVTSVFFVPLYLHFLLWLVGVKIETWYSVQVNGKERKKKRNTNKNKNAVQPMESTTTGKEGEKERERDLSIFFSNKGAFFFFVCVCCCCCFACLFVCLTRLSKSVRWSCWEHVGSNEHVSVRICVMKLRDTSEQNKKKKRKKEKQDLSYKYSIYREGRQWSSTGRLDQSTRKKKKKEGSLFLAFLAISDFCARFIPR